MLVTDFMLVTDGTHDPCMEVAPRPKNKGTDERTEWQCHFLSYSLQLKIMDELEEPCTTLYNIVPPSTTLYNYTEPCTRMGKNVRTCTTLYNLVKPCTNLYKHILPCTGWFIMTEKKFELSTHSKMLHMSCKICNFLPWHWDIWILCFQKLQYETTKISEGEENLPQIWKNTWKYSKLKIF